MKYRNNTGARRKFKKIIELLEIILFCILTGIFVLIVWMIEGVLEEKVEHSSEVAFSKVDTLIFLSNSSRYDFIVAISIGIVLVAIGYCLVKRRISKLTIICTLICIITGTIGVYNMRCSYINVTYDGVYIGGAISREKIYKFENVSNIQSYCTKKTGKNSTYYKFNYSIIMNDGQTIELSKDIAEKEIFKLDKVHRLLVDKYKITYYCTGVNDLYYNKLLLDNLYDDDSKKAIQDIFEDKTQKPLTS